MMLLYSFSEAQDITQGEYFIDTDPGVGLATTLTTFSQNDTVNITENISLTGYSAGFHNLYIRFKTVNGTWSVIDARSFYISPAINANVDTIVAAETFIDTDPGSGNGTAISVSPATVNASISSTVSTTGYLAGFHNLYFRAKNKAGVWNVIDNKSFFLKLAETPVTEITKLEYFIDTDPGVGLAYNVPIPSAPNDTVILNHTSLVPCVNNGTHYLWLRAKNNLGVWNVVDHDTLTVGGAMVTQPISSTGPDTVCIPNTVTMFADSAINVTYQWLESGNPIGGATFAKYTASVSGNYSLRQTCSATSSVVVSNIKNVIVNDVPDITFCPSVAPVNNEVGLCSAIITYVSATAIGSIPLPVITYSQSSGTAFNVGTTTVNVVATNMCGVDNCNFNVVINDNENPVISCPSAITINCQDSQLPANTGSATATDNCDLNPSISYNDAIVAGNCPGNYLINRTWTAKDIYTNASMCLQVITVRDITAPVITCPNNITINCQDSQLPANTGSATSNDNCDANPVITYSDVIVTGNCPGNYIINRKWTATDICNNFSTCTQIITVQDISAPVITCPNAVTINCQDSQLPANTGSATAIDNCDVNPVISYADVIVVGNCLGNYTINRTWTSIDNCNNANTCLQIITVQDITLPTIICPNDSILDANIPDCLAKIDLNVPIAFDNCGTVLISNNAPATFPRGTTIVTWTATDACNNTASCTQNVIVTPCIILNLKAFIEGFYIGNGIMQAVLFNSGESNDNSICDSIIIELHDQNTYAIIGNPQKVLLTTNGHATIYYPDSYTGGSYYIVLRHRNMIETWSKFPVLFNNVINSFDFTSP